MTSIDSTKIQARDIHSLMPSKFVQRQFFWFFSVCALLILLAIISAEHFIPENIWKTVSITLLANLFASSLMVLMFYVFYRYFIGYSHDSELIALKSQDILSAIKTLPEDTSFYGFLGRSGTHFRTSTIQRLIKESKKNNTPIDIMVILPDYKNQTNSDAYNQIRASLGTSRSPETLQANIAATIITCATADAHNKALSFRVFCGTSLPAFRLDVSDRGAIMTSEEKKLPAIMASENSSFLDMFKSIALHESSLSKEMVWPKTEFLKSPLANENSSPQLLETILGIEISDKLYDKVCLLLEAPTNRYE